jgi:ComF family protein
LRSWSVFEAPVRNALHRLKYRRDIGLGEALTPQLSEFVASLHWPVDIVVPVPLGRKRLLERGYNQVNLIARPLSMAMRLPYTSDALARHHETRSQVGLSRSQRQENVRGAFLARGGRVTGRTVLLVDDVATTGSTLSSCAEALYAAGARDVFAFTVSRAVPKHGLQNA